MTDSEGLCLFLYSTSLCIGCILGQVFLREGSGYGPRQPWALLILYTCHLREREKERDIHTYPFPKIPINPQERILVALLGWCHHLYSGRWGHQTDSPTQITSGEMVVTWMQVPCSQQSRRRGSVREANSTKANVVLSASSSFHR